MGGAVLAAVLAVLLCLFPKPENDLFFELRTGTDILTSGHLPHTDTYSWVRYGTPWTVPEWLAFVVYAAAFKAGGFFGTWLVLAALTAATALVVYSWLARRAGPGWAFPLTALMLLGMKDTVQERPYAFTYLLLAVSLPIVLRARVRRPTLLFWLLPICALWTNLHQGVVVLIGLLFVLAAGEALVAAGGRWRAAPDLLTETGRRQEARTRRVTHRQWISAGRMAGAAVVCAGAALLSPYGWHVYWNIWITLRNHSLMANVTEWNPATTLPLLQWQPFLLMGMITLGAVLSSHRRRRLADLLVLLALFVEALLHARNMALFAVGAVIVAAPHIPSAWARVRLLLGLAGRPALPRWFPAMLALGLVAVTGLAASLALRPALGPRGLTPEGIGEAAIRLPDYPERACAFMDAEHFPTNLRLLNDFETGGYLMWRRPRQKVFTDGRLDVYVGQAFDDMVTLSRKPGSPAWGALVQKYDFNCVLTSNSREAAAFAARPDWVLVYKNPAPSQRSPRRPRFRLLLRRRPALAALIARCQRN